MQRVPAGFLRRRGITATACYLLILNLANRLIVSIEEGTWRRFHLSNYRLTETLSAPRRSIRRGFEAGAARSAIGDPLQRASAVNREIAGFRSGI